MISCLTSSSVTDENLNSVAVFSASQIQSRDILTYMYIWNSTKNHMCYMIVIEICWLDQQIIESNIWIAD